MTNKNFFALDELVSIKNGKIIYTVSTADKKEPVKTFEVNLYKDIVLEDTGNPKMDAFIEKANAKIAELVKGLNDPASYAEQDEKDETKYTMKKLNSISTMVGRNVKLIKTLCVFAKVDVRDLRDEEYDFIMSMTALDRKIEVKAFAGMTLAEFYAANGKIKKSFDEFKEILATKGLQFKADLTGIIAL